MNGPDRLRPRRWQFSNCTFDESNWTLFVAGRRMAIEAKPLELLRELLVADGELVTKAMLLDRIWPDVHVVEASLTTAVHKLRHALGDDQRKRRMIETVAGLGYRLAVPAESENIAPALPLVATALDSDPSSATFAAVPSAGSRKPNVAVLRLLAIAAGAGLVTAPLAIAYGLSDEAGLTEAPSNFSQRQAATALRQLDIPEIERLLAAGWSPKTYFDTVETDALTHLLNMCEWDPRHDQRKMLLMARTLIDGGAEIDNRNVFGDTAYSIAKAPRYCGPDHPVTQMLEAICYGGEFGPKDLCLATYELTADQRKAQGLPPKGSAKRATSTRERQLSPHSGRSRRS